MLDALYHEPHERTLDVLGLDYYDPMASRHFRIPGHRTAGGRNLQPTRELWDDPPEPLGLTRWLEVQHALTPDAAAVGGRERTLQPGAQRAFVPPPGRVGPSAVPA